MAGITLRGDREVLRAISDLRKLLVSDREKALRILGTEFVRDAQRNIREQHGPNGQKWPGPPKRGGQRLQDTKRLYNSLTYQLASRRSVLVGTNVIYAAIHQFGGTIKPKRKKKLFQPINRRIARQYSGDARRDFPGAFVLSRPSAAGNLVLARKTGKGGAIEVIGILRDETRIEASPYLGESKRAWDQSRKRIGDLVKIAWPQGATT